MKRRAVSAALLVGVALGAGGCLEALLGPPVSTSVSLASATRALGGWRGTWRTMKGADGEMRVSLRPSDAGRVAGTVQFIGGVCSGVASLDGTLEATKLVMRGDLGPPCGATVLEIIESRSEVPRLVGRFQTDYPEEGLFAIYPR